MTSAAEQSFSTLDIHLAAFLSLRGYPPELECNNGRVIFRFPAIACVFNLVNDFTANAAVPVADFAGEVKALRGRMFAAKQNAG